MSLRKVGASITSIITSSTYLMTTMIQLTLRELGVKTILPENIFLLVVGGLLGMLGIILIHKNSLIIVSFRSWSRQQFHQGLARKVRKDE